MAVQPEHFASSRDRDVARTDQSWPALDQAQQFFAVQTTPCLLAQLLAPAGQQDRRHWLTDSGLMGPGWPYELASHGLNSQSLWHDHPSWCPPMLANSNRQIEGPALMHKGEQVGLNEPK